MRRAALSYLFGVLLLTGSLWFSNGGLPFAYAADVDPSQYDRRYGSESGSSAGGPGHGAGA